MKSRLCILVAMSLALAACEKKNKKDLPPLDGEEVGAIASIELVANPNRPFFVSSERVRVDAIVRDTDGNVVEDVEVQWRASNASRDPEGLFQLLSRESVATITGCVAELIDPNDERWMDADDDGLLATDVCDTLELGVDNAPPTLVLTSPQPGAQLDLADGAGVVLVEGTIEDSNPEARLQVFVNDVSIPIEEDGSFSYELPLSYGINRVAVEGRDGFHTPSTAELDVLAADGWLAPEEGTTRFSLDNTIGLRIGQKFFDAYVGGTTIDPHSFPVYADDLASIVEVILANMDLASLFGDGPVIEVDDVITLSVTNVSVGDPIVDLAIIDETGLELMLNVNDVFVGTDGALNLFDAHFELLGGLRVDLSGRISIELHIGEDDQITSSMTVHSFDISTIRPEFVGNDGEFFNALINLGTVQRTFRDLIEEQIGTELIDEFLGVIPATITDLLGSIGGILNGLSFTLDPGFAPAITIELGSSLGALELRGGATDGGLDASLNATVEVSSAGGPFHVDSRGLPMASLDPMMPFNNISAIQLAIRQDFVNGLLHGVWNSGLLNSLVEFSGIEIQLDAKLPPVLTMAPLSSRCRIDDVRCDALVQIGQLELVAFGQRLGVSLEAGATIAFSGNDIVLNVSEEPDIRVWRIEGDSTIFTPQLIEGLVYSMLWPEISGFIGTGFAFSLPLPTPADIGIADFAPALADSVLTLQALGRINSQTGYLGLGADIVLTSP